jgi:hypothetical protein
MRFYPKLGIDAEPHADIGASITTSTVQAIARRDYDYGDDVCV